MQKPKTKNQKSKFKAGWKLKSPAPKSFFEEFPEFSPIVLQLLYNRGITKEREIEKFLNPDWERDLYDPFLMKGMKEAILRIKKAAKKKEKIGIFGHFDVDGIASSVLLSTVLKKLGFKVFVYLPDREEGYGLVEQAVDYFHKQSVGLIITVDNGSTSFFGVKLASRLGMDVIISDHHEILKEKGREKIPKAVSFINPNQKSCKYPFKELAGVGVTFKLVQALSSSQKAVVSSQYLKWLVDLVGLGTICDVAPLVDENRIFAKFGLVVLNKTKRIGLQILYQTAQIDEKKIDPYLASFVIGPRLNASSRMDHANASFYLLTTSNKERALKLANYLTEINKKRQNLLSKVLQEAKKEVEKGGHLDKKLILIGKENWPSGLIGLIAGRLKDEYSRPVVALSLGREKSKGSARSIDAFHITRSLAECSDYLVRYGGHKKAAGFSVLTEKIEKLKKRLIELAEVKISDEDIKPSLKIDAKIGLDEINWELWGSLEKFEPTGFGNEKPVFLTEGVRIAEIKTVGREAQHLKMKLNGFDALFFGQGDLAFDLRPSDIIDVAFQIGVDEWNSERKLSLKVVDIKKTKNLKLKTKN